MEPEHRELSALLVRDLIVALAPFRRLAIRGPLPPAAGGLPEEAIAADAAVADELADQTGVIACEGMQASAATPVSALSAHESLLSSWRFLTTVGSDDLADGRQATAAVAADLPESAAALTAAAAPAADATGFPPPGRGPLLSPAPPS
jgi:hypothetical protein